MSFFSWLFPKEKDFYGMLTAQSQVSLKGVRLFCQYMCGSGEACAGDITDVEHEGDKVRRLLIDDLNKTYITPMEREDIFSLSGAIDDILDICKSATREFVIYKLKPDESLNKILEKNAEAMEHLHEAVLLLKEHPGISVEKCTKAKDAVEDVELLYYEALAELTESNDVKHMFKMREIQKRLASISRRIGDAANIVLNIIVKAA